MECEILLSMIIKILESDAMPLWHRVMLMEILQETCANDQIIKFIYVNYDCEDSSLNLFQDLIRIFNRIITSYKQNNIMSNIIPQQLQSLGNTEFTLKTCKPNIRCIERYEKHDPPYIPDNYIVYLSIKSILSIISSLAKNIRPLLDNDEKIEINDKSLINNVYVVHEMANVAWSGILASFSFLFTIHIDDDIFDEVIKSFSQFTIICAVLKLNTPRNAFLTLLCKSIIPIESTNKQNDPTSAKNNITMNNRNLKCLQSLLDITKVIFNTFDDVTWYLILDTLQAANSLLYGSKVGGRLQITSNSNSINNISKAAAAIPTAITAIGSSSGVSTDGNDQTLSYSAQLESQFTDLTAAIDQFFENTLMLDENTFNDFINALSRMVCDSSGLAVNDISNLSSKVNLEGYSFSVSKLRYVILLNIKKVVSQDSMNIWDLVMQRLIETVHKPNLNITIRKEICNAINDILASAVQNIDYRNEQSEIKILEPLKLLMKVRNQEFEEQEASADAESQNSWIIDIQKSCLETLNNILQTSGQNFVNGWNQIFSIINRVLLNSMKLNEEGHHLSTSNYQFHKNAALSLIRMVFPCLQLICSDFLSLLNPKDFYTCIETVALFGRQIEDLNISLTAIGLSWNLCDYLQTHKQEVQAESGSPPNDHSNDLTEDTLKAILSTGQSTLIVAKDSEAYENLAHQKMEKVADSLWMVLLSKLSELCSDERPEVRTSALQTLFRTITMNGNQLSLHLWVEWIFCILFPLLQQLDTLYHASIEEEERKEKEKELQYGKKRKSTLSINPIIKHWDETRSYTINSVTQCFKDYFEIMRGFGEEGFNLAWSKFIEFIHRWIVDSSQEVSISGLVSIKNFVERPENEEENPKESTMSTTTSTITPSSSLYCSSHYQEKLLDLWKLGQKIGQDIIQSATPYREDPQHPDCLTSIYGTYTEQTLNAYVSIFPSLYPVIHDRLELEDLQSLFDVLTKIILYHTYPVVGTRVLTYIGDKEVMSPCQNHVIQLLLLILQDLKANKFGEKKEGYVDLILSKLLLYSKFFVWEDDRVLVSYHAKKPAPSVSEEETSDLPDIPYQYSYIAFSSKALTILTEFFDYISQEDPSIYTKEIYVNTLNAFALPMKLKYNCPRPESQKNDHKIWKSATDAFNNYALKGLETNNSNMTEKQKQNICETVINTIIDYFSKEKESTTDQMDSNSYTEFEQYNNDNLKTFEKEFILCLCQGNLSEESLVKYVKLIEEGSSVPKSTSENSEDPIKVIQSNTSQIFSSLCLNSLFEICDSTNNHDSSSSNAIKLVAPILLNICEITIKNYVKDFVYAPAETIPKSRTTEMENILDRLYKLNFKENAIKISDNNSQFPYRKGILTGKGAHLFYLHSSLIECIGLTDKEIQNKVKLCLKRIGQELGL